MSDQYKELVQNIADDILPILMQVDMLCLKYKIEDLKKILGGMRHDVAMLEALPFPETMRKAEVMKAQTDIFEAFVVLLEVRKRQFEIQRKLDITPGREVLKAMGLL